MVVDWDNLVAEAQSQALPRSNGLAVATKCSAVLFKSRAQKCGIAKFSSTRRAFLQVKPRECDKSWKELE